MRLAAVSACPTDAAEEVKAYCDYVLSKKGGAGAVWEFVEMLLKVKSLWEEAVNYLFPISESTAPL